MGKTKSRAAAATAPLHKYTNQQLCRVRRVSAGELKPGVVLAFDGAWQHKRVVVSVTYIGPVLRHGNPAHEFRVVVAALGRFFADGRMEPSPENPQSELVVYVYQSGYLDGLGSWLPVEPIDGPLLPPLRLRYDKKAKHPIPVGGAKYADPPKINPADYGAEPLPGKISAHSDPSRPPEAILADFLIV